MKKSTLKKTVLSLAIVASLGATASASATVITADWGGLFTMLDSGGAPLGNTSNPYYSDPTWLYGLRTPISGTMSFDTATGLGSATVVPFNFFKGTSPAAAVGITFQAIGNGMGGAGNLVLGNMLFNWSGNNGIPVSIVLDASGFFAAQQAGLTVGQVITGTGVLPASNAIKGGKIPIGLAPIATTTWNTTTCAGAGIGSAVSGCMPLIADTIGGSPMIAGPFPNDNANFDMTKITITGISGGTVVPVPAAVWLLGSGLLGLVGVARRKKTA